MFESLSGECSHLYLAIDGVLVAVIAITDPIREEAPQVVSMLRKCGLSKIVMMTGDSERTAEVVAAKLALMNIIRKCFRKIKRHMWKKNIRQDVKLS